MASMRHKLNWARAFGVCSDSSSTRVNWLSYWADLPKKPQKTPKKEIDEAVGLLNSYYEDKKKKDRY